MTRNQFLVVLAALVVLVAAGLLLKQTRESAWHSGDNRVGQKLMPDLKLENVATIVIRDPDATLTLVSRDGGWRVKERADFPADADRVRDLLLRLIELKVVQTETVAEAQRARLQLLEPGAGRDAGAGTRIELRDGAGAVLARLLLGKKVTAMVAGAAIGPETGTPTGRYAMSGDASDSVALVSESLAQAEAKPEPWLSKELIRVERTKSISATGPDGKQRFAVTRDSEASDWKLAGGGKPDGGRIQDAVSALASMSLADVVADPAKADLDHADVVKAQTFDDLTYTIRIGAQAKNDRYYAAISVSGDPPAARVAGKGESAEEKAKQDKTFEERRAKLADRLAHEKTLDRWTYLVPKSSVEPLLRERAKFLPEKKVAKKP